MHQEAVHSPWVTSFTHWSGRLGTPNALVRSQGAAQAALGCSLYVSRRSFLLPAHRSHFLIIFAANRDVKPNCEFLSLILLQDFKLSFSSVLSPSKTRAQNKEKELSVFPGGGWSWLAVEFTCFAFHYVFSISEPLSGNKLILL